MKPLGVLAAFALTLAAFGQVDSNRPATKTVPLPSSKLLFEPVPGSPVPTNSFPGTMALSPDRRYAVILNNGRGTAESQFNQSIGVYDFESRKLRDFPDPRFKLNAAQTIYYGVAFSSRGNEVYVSVGSLTDPEGLREGDLGNGIAVYSLKNGALTPTRFLKLPMQKIPNGHRQTEVCKRCAPGQVPEYPAGLAVLPGAKGEADRLVIAGNLADNVLVVDASNAKVLQTFDVSADEYVPAVFPYQVLLDPVRLHVFVSLWNTDKVVDIDLRSNKIVRTISLEETQPAPSRSSAHPAALAFSVDGQHLFVALANRDQVVIVDRNSGKVEGRISTRLPFQRFGGAYPVSLAVDPNGKTLYVANSGTNSITLYDVSWSATSTSPAARSHFSKSTFRGAIPTEWYPVAIQLREGELLVATAKAQGVGPNNQKAIAGDTRKKFRYIGGMVYGSLANIKLTDVEKNLPTLTNDVERSNRLKDNPRRRIAFRGLGQPAFPIKHVIYIIKENRTYDQVLGDLGAGNGDPSLTLYGWDVTPNHHKLALQFGVLDNFYASGEISGNGHVWSTAAITSDYTEKSWQINYRGNERTYDFEGAVANEIPLEQRLPDLDEPGTGFLWANAKRSGVTYRHYGEFVESVWCVPAGDWEMSPANVAIRAKSCAKKTMLKGDPLPANLGGGPSPWPWEIPILALDRATKPELLNHFDPLFADFRTEYPDQMRMDEFLREFNQFVTARKRHDLAHQLPQLIVMRLPNDHTGGTRERFPTPAASVADNDLALGRLVEAVSNSPYWNDTAILVLEDDAQDGPDHVDAHRSPAMIISKYSPSPINGKAFVESGFFTTVNMIRTLEDLLHMPPMNHNDALAMPLASLFDGKGDQAPYHADDKNLKNGLLLTVNPPKARGSETSERMDFSAPDRINAAELNQILWENVKGDEPMPPPRHTVIPERAGSGEEH